jgi:3-hydroxyacyl-[acyl-carrier-protein] dehydratase
MFELVQSLTVDAAAGVASGRARIGDDLPFLIDHFPGHPILPGSLAIELLAQIAGPLAEEVDRRERGAERWSFLGMVRNATFHAPARLPATLDLEARIQRAQSSGVLVAASARGADRTLLCRAELVMMLRDADPDWTDAIAAYRARLARWKRTG